MNEQKIYIAHLKAYKCMLNLSRELKTKTKPMIKRKTVRPGVREISLVSIYGESLRWKRLEEEVCFKTRVKKRSDWRWQRWRWQCGSDLCRVVRRWRTRMCMRLTERSDIWVFMLQKFLSVSSRLIYAKLSCGDEILFGWVIYILNFEY